MPVNSDVTFQKDYALDIKAEVLKGDVTFHVHFRLIVPTQSPAGPVSWPSK